LPSRCDAQNTAATVYRARSQNLTLFFTSSTFRYGAGGAWNGQSIGKDSVVICARDLLPPDQSLKEMDLDLDKVVASLRQQYQEITKVIRILESLVDMGERRRGRPPRWLTALKRGDTGSGSQQKVNKKVAKGKTRRSA
jgi:hypothetical protein